MRPQPTIPRAPGRPSVDRRVLQALVDMAAWAVAVAGATWARWDFEVQPVYCRGLVVAATSAACLQAAAGYLNGLYRGRRRFGTFDEVAVLVRAAATTAVLLMVLVIAARPPRLVPLSAPLIGAVLALTLMGLARYTWRLRLDRQRRPSGDEVARTLVFGAGEGGAQVVAAMLRDPSSPYLPVGLLDDSPRKRRLSIMGVPVLGDRYAMAEVAGSRRASVLLIAIPSADARLVGELTDRANESSLTVLVLPPVGELIGGKADLGDIRALTETDLLGRREIDTDIASIAQYLRGRRVLVTGAGGSIGSELCRQICRFAPAELLKLDHDESALHAVQLSIEGRALLDGGDLILLDIRDRQALRELFQRRRPQVVFHAAALKHLPLLEQFPAEGLRTNVLATLDLLRLSRDYGVERFVNVSTDKAADPISVLGYTKRLAERLTAHVAGEAQGIFLSVRFGNVLGSRGSVLTAFRAQFETGGPITVTHPDVTRYFMTVEEAVQLVVQAGAIARPGQALVLDMGAPVRIASVAERLSARSDRPIQIVYTGLRPGEKLEEVLLGEAEQDLRPVHPLITHVDVPPLHPDELLGVDTAATTGDLVHALARLACSRPTADLAGQREATC